MATIFFILIQANDDSLKLVATQLGIPAGTRTPTNSFGDWYAAITLPRYIFWWGYPESNREAEAADFKSAVFTYFTIAPSFFF